MADIDFLVHLHDFVVQIIPLRFLDAIADGLANGMPTFVHRRWPPSAGPHNGGEDESAQRLHLHEVSTRPPPSRKWAAFGLDHLDRLRVLQVANPHRLAVIHLDESPEFIRDLQPALLLQTFKDRVLEAVPARLLIRQQLDRAHTRFSHAGEARVLQTPSTRWSSHCPV